MTKSTKRSVFLEDGRLGLDNNRSERSIKARQLWESVTNHQYIIEKTTKKRVADHNKSECMPY